MYGRLLDKTVMPKYMNFIECFGWCYRYNEILLTNIDEIYAGELELEEKAMYEKMQDYCIKKRIL